MKRCNKCGELKPLDQYYRAAGMKDGHRGDCKVCNLAYQHRRYMADPEPVKVRVKRWQQANAAELNAYRRRRREDPIVKSQDRAGHLRRKYGISLAEYDEMLAAQDGRCFLCGSPPEPPYSLHVDHDHTTGRVRKLLCFSCNNALGNFADDPDRLQKAAYYVEADVPRDPALERRLAELKAMPRGWERTGT